MGEWENKWVLRAVLKEEKVGSWRTNRGREFQECGPEQEKPRRPKVLSLVRGVHKMRGSEEERRERGGLYILSELDRYSGAALLRLL